MQRDAVDFHEVSRAHAKIHGHLLNWARWAAPRRAGASTSPMFRQYRSTDNWVAPESSIPVDRLKAADVEKSIVALPDKHKAAIVWSYIKCYQGMSVGRICFALAVNPQGLSALVHEGRAMLVNRGV